MPDPNLDRLKAVSPSLVAIEWVDTDADKTNQQHCPLCFEIKEGFGHADDCEYPAIKADMLRLAEENERLRKVEEFTKKFTRIEEINEKQEERQRKHIEDTQKGSGPSKLITPVARKDDDEKH